MPLLSIMDGHLTALAYWVSGDISDGGEKILLSYNRFIARQVQELRENPRLTRKC